MYRGFNLTGFNSLKDHSLFNEYLSIGNKIYENNQKIILENLENYIIPESDGVISASLMQKDWFPSVSADVFISHSSKDRDLAVALAGMLSEVGVTAFVDSCIWGCCDNLLHQIDKLYCRVEGKSTYSYEKRNCSTSHVHMMLTNALTEMMDKTECIFFLNTDKSVPVVKGIEKETYSPWIFHEIAMTKYLRVNVPKRFQKKIMLSEGEKIAQDEFPAFAYNLDLSALKEISYLNFRITHICSQILNSTGTNFLDYFYGKNNK